MDLHAQRAINEPTSDTVEQLTCTPSGQL